MARPPTLSFDRDTLLLHSPPPSRARIDYATWDDRVERFRLPALHYRRLTEALRAEGTPLVDKACESTSLTLVPALEMQPYPHQRAALAARLAAGRRGVVVLPTGAGKTYLAQLAMQETPYTTLTVASTLDLLYQWYAHLLAAFPDAPVGLLGGGSHDHAPLLVATYDSAAIHAGTLGNRYALLIFDERNHLPGTFTRVTAEYSLAQYRLGLTATPERSDGTHADLETLTGPEVYRTSVAALAGTALAPHRVVRLTVSLSQRECYEALLATRNRFLQACGLRLGSVTGWQAFVRASTRSRAGRPAMLAHREARAAELLNGLVREPQRFRWRKRFPANPQDRIGRRRHPAPIRPAERSSLCANTSNILMTIAETTATIRSDSASRTVVKASPLQE